MFFLFSFLSHKQHVNNFIQVVFNVILLFHVLNVQMDWHLLIVNANVFFFCFVFTHSMWHHKLFFVFNNKSFVCWMQIRFFSSKWILSMFCFVFFLIPSLFFNPKLCSMQWCNNMHNVFIFIKHFSWKWSMSLFVFVFILTKSLFFHSKLCFMQPNRTTLHRMQQINFSKQWSLCFMQWTLCWMW